MAEQHRTDDHWRELADLLGVPGDNPAKASPPMPPRKTEAPPSSAPREFEEERPIPHVTHQPRLEPIADEASPGWESEFDDTGDDTAIDESVLRDEPAGEEPVDGEGEEFVEAGGEDMAEPAENGAPVSEEDKPRRGRRRRRRGRRGAGMARIAPSAPDQAANRAGSRTPSSVTTAEATGVETRSHAVLHRRGRNAASPLRPMTIRGPNPRRPWKLTMTPTSATGMSPAGKI